MGHHRLVRALLCALLLTAACKADKPAADKGATPVEKSTTPAGGVQDPPSTAHRERPQLPRADIPETRDWNDPAVREEMEQRRAEREQRMKEQLDTNKDGVVSPEERAQRAKPLFDRLDENQDGKLTTDELANNTKRRMQFDDPSAIDTDKNGEVSLTELEAAMTARREKMRERWRGGGPAHVGAGSD